MSSSAPTRFSRPFVLQAFQAMQSKGCKPDSIVYNAIIDALWDTGIVWAQQHAAVLYRRASAAGASSLAVQSTASG